MPKKQQQPSQVSPELDEMVCDLIGYMLDELADGGDPVMTPTPSEQAAAVLNLIEAGVIGWNEPDVMKVLNGA